MVVLRVHPPLSQAYFAQFCAGKEAGKYLVSRLLLDVLATLRDQA
jgi:hypothetical protein